MGDSILNFNDIGDPSYTGLSDTGFGFSGSSTLQDVTLGAPIPLDTSLGPSTTAVTDFVGVQPITSDLPNQISLSPAAQALSGNSDPGFSPTGTNAQNPAATPHPNAAPPNDNSAAGLTALSKFGASFASLFAGPAVTHQGAVAQQATIAGGPLPPGAMSGTTTIILIVVVGALILLLARGD
jgi:hypothetical protein